MQREKVRVYALARELNLESKDLLDLCRQHGMDVKNQLSSLDPEQRDAIEVLIKRGSKGGAAVAVAPSAPVQPLPSDLSQKVRVLAPARRPSVEPAPVPPPALQRPVAAVTPPMPVAEVQPEAAPTPLAPPEAVPPPAVASTPVAPVVSTPAPVEMAPTPPVAVPTHPVAPAAPAASAAEPSAPAKTSELPKPLEQPRVIEPPPVKPTQVPPPVRPPMEPSRVPDLAAAKVPTLSGAKPPTLNPSPRPDAQPGRHRSPRQIRPMMGPRPGFAPPPQLKPTIIKKPVERTQQPIAQKPIAPLTPEMKKGTLSPQGLKDATTRLVSGSPAPPADGVVDEDDGDQKGATRPGGVPGRDARHLKRSERQKQRKEKAEADLRAGRITLDADDDRPQRGHKSAKELLKKKLERGTKPRIGRVPIDLPITVRTLSAAVGKPVGELLFKLRDHGAPATLTINSTLDPVMAELIAHDIGIDLEIKKPLDVEGQVVGQVDKPDRPEDLAPRPPIVTIMGHVDHGKTTLLDKIRESNIAATEAGGITQVIRAWRVEHNGKSITFLDTPGHEAFTKMRARGANVTDIAVIVVAADDGVMPQTEEAVNHARAAGVSMVVAINKVDLPNANLNKTRQQLYGLGLLPDNMGGDIPFVETSGAKGSGIDDLLENILLVAELKELKANANKPARGTCLEAMLTEGEGVNATLLVRDGTLHRGDVVLCGGSYGRVRAMYDDLGRPIQEAGPSVPARITGLSAVPNADDPFQAVEELGQAREIAERRQSKQQETAATPRTPIADVFVRLAEAKVPELKLILKADFRGSIEAIKKELEKLAHAEVRVNLLHTAIGGITESDVTLALTSPEDTIIVGFNVVPDDRAHALAEERGVQIREYDIIYNLTDDIRSALEGKLKPHEQVVHLGRAVVRKTFKIGRVGTVAGCYVTQGVIERSAKIRLIRQGVVIYPPADRTASLDSLKRFKEDSREVREGFECGIKLAGYDDLKVDDVIEAYRVEQVQRTLGSAEKK